MMISSATGRLHKGTLKTACLMACLWLLGNSGIAAPRILQTRFLEGTVRDESGAPIAGAEVILSAGVASSSRITDSGGHFVFEVTWSGAAALTVSALGFGTTRRQLSADAVDDELQIVLPPAPLSEQVTVTAARTETRVSDTAASVVVVSREDLATTGALTIDDALRQVSGFSLFRRSGSRTANPTTQGVSLRGVGASGASRAVVLSDGLPINDPFGGWIYWGRVPRESIGRIEVVRGGVSDLWGTDALGGVINFIPRNIEDPSVSFEASIGNQLTPAASFFAGGRIGQIGARLAAEAFSTDGYIIVDPRERGRVDVPANARNSSIDLTLERLFSEAGRVFIRGSLFGESRENGTPLQQNRTHIRQLAIGGDWRSGNIGELAARAYASSQVFDQDFSAVAPDRNSELLTRSQRVPAQQTGATGQWLRGVSRHTLVAGLDAREVRGASDELVFIGGSLSSAVGAGGRERRIGVFGQDIVRLTPRWLLTVGARVDRWRHFGAHSTSQPLAQPGPVSVTGFDERVESAFSPRISLLHRLTGNVSVSAAGYRAFRAPTLNELYRAFRVGSVLTLANERLRAERLTGGEAGVSVSAFDQTLNIRGVFFWSEVTRAVANVTLNVTPALITRQRQNLGRTRSRGIEIESEFQLTTMFGISAGYQLVDATVREFPANRSLEGSRIPQVPRQQLTFQVRYSNPDRIFLGFQGRAIGAQFDDDLNLFKLDPFFTLDALASRPVASGIELFAAAENLLDQRYTVGRTPVRTIGPPLLFRMGIRLRSGAR